MFAHPLLYNAASAKLPRGRRRGLFGRRRRDGHTPADVSGPAVGSEDAPKERPPHGRYYVQGFDSKLMDFEERRAMIQGALDAGEEEGWALMHVAGAGMGAAPMYLFWDTRPSASPPG